MTDQNCAYCMEGDLVAQSALKSVNFHPPKFIYLKNKAIKDV